MKIYIVVDESSFKKISRDEKDLSKITIIVDNVIPIPAVIAERCKIVPLIKSPEPLDRRSCDIFTREFQRNGDFRRYSVDIEPHINGIYEYVVSSINDILFTLESVVELNDEIFLSGGNRNLKISACYAVKSPEFNKNVFFNRADVINPLLYEALARNNKNVFYYESAFIYSFSKYLLRIVALFGYSYLATLIKYIVGCCKTRDHIAPLTNEEESNYIIFPVRSNPQVDYADSVARKMEASEGILKPIIFYYEMLLGKSFNHRFINCNYSFVTLFKYKYIGMLILLPILTACNMVLCYSFLKRKPPLSLVSGPYVYKMPLSFLAFENFAAPHIYFYEVVLKKCIAKFGSKKDTNISGVCSTEMIGQQVFVERSVAQSQSLRFNNIQTSVVHRQNYPIKAVGDHTLCLSKNYADNFTQAGIANKGRAIYIGELKYLSSESINNKGNNSLKIILYASQPYEPSLSQDFLRELSSWLRDNMPLVRLRLRIHPRDNVSNYSLLKDVEIVPNKETVAESVNNASLVLTRTSSVIIDAIGFRVPYILCKLSNIDLQVDQYMRIPELSVFNCQELVNKLGQFKVLADWYNLHLLEKDVETDSVLDDKNESIRCFMGLFGIEER